MFVTYSLSGRRIPIISGTGELGTGRRLAVGNLTAARE
jgi:hypothetical protein